MAYINVQIKLNDVDISQYVVSYTREHKICTGIGTLSMEVTYELVNDLIPWDAIDIYEGGDHVGTYYVGTITDNQPAATLSIEAQDNSKRLSDYFITDTYLIDYISYTRYWIEYFLQEVGIQYEFLVSGDGSLINQNTSLGLVSAYEQIQTLLQMSGWYITFNTSGKALIGKLTTNISNHSHRLNLHDMTEFKLIQSDKMYRNRALIWGTGSPSSGEWVFADVTRHTRWDYDNNDLRTVVIGNSAIPDVASAFMLANQLLIEFCRLNEEKDMTLIGTYNNLNVGSSVRVQTRVWTGSGLVTTFGVNMTRSGLTTHVVLDERCPRLYGFFDLGGKVYVGTFGSGVWRHDIKYLGAEWEDYSSGVAPQTTDLHVNNGVLAAVGAGGDAYYNLEGSLPWHQFPIADLPFVVSGEVTSGITSATISGTVSSGLMVRACILDRTTNRLRYAVDTRSGYNLGDYLMETDPLVMSGQISILSGILAASSGLRSWIVDGNPYDGSIGAIYPINISGNFECAVFDIENDGVTDYVSVAEVQSGVLSVDYGKETNTTYMDTIYSQSWETIHDKRMITSYGTDTFEDDKAITFGMYVPLRALSLFNYMSTEEKAFIAYARTATLTTKKFRVDEAFKYAPNIIAGMNYESSGVSNSVAFDNRDVVMAIYNDTSHVFSYVGGHSKKLVTVDYNIDNNTTTVSEVVPSPLITPVGGAYVGPDNTIAEIASSHPYLVLGDYYYGVFFVGVQGTNGEDNDRIDVYLLKLNLKTGDNEYNKVFSWIPYVYRASLPRQNIYDLAVHVCLNQYREGENEDIQVVIQYLKSIDEATNSPVDPYEYHGYVYRYIQKGFYNSLGITPELVYDLGVQTSWGVEGVDFEAPPETDRPHSAYYGGLSNYGGGEFKNNIRYRGTSKDKPLLIYEYDHPTNTLYFVDTGDNYFVSETNPLADFEDIYYTRTSRTIDYAIAKNLDGSFSVLDADSLEVRNIINADQGYYTLMDYCSAVDDYYDGLFFIGRFWDTYWEDYSYDVVRTYSDGTVNKGFNYAGYPAPTNPRLIGSFMVMYDPVYPKTTYFDNHTIDIVSTSYYVLQRNNDQYNVIYSGAFRPRVEISNLSPLVVMDRVLSSITVYDANVSGLMMRRGATMSGFNLGGVAGSGGIFASGILIDDYRYSDFEWMPGHTLERDLFAAYNGDLGIADLDSLTAFSGLFLSPSGHIIKVEASNFSLPEQYTFLATSGDVGGYGFFEKTPSGFSFVPLTEGFPQVRPTIIRLDDKL